MKRPEVRMAAARSTIGSPPVPTRCGPPMPEQHDLPLVKLYKAGKLGDVGKSYRPLTDVEMELARTKKELAEVKMERDILKKAAAYFARKSLPGTR